MKNGKMLAVAALLVMATMLVGCGNMSMGLGEFEFKRIHVDTYRYSGCFTVEKWYESDTGIEVKTDEYGNLCFSEGQYVLIEDECPFCEETQYETEN